VRSRIPTVLLAALLLMGLLAGCGGDAPEPASGPGLPSQAELKAYFQAVTSADAKQIARAQSDIAADGSLAQGYADYIAQSDEAAKDAGQPMEPVDIEEVDGGFKACASADQCVTWTDLVGKDGRLADFSVNDKELDNSLLDLTGQLPIRSPGLYSVQPEWAYRRPISGALNVVVRVTASDVPLTPRPGIYIEQDTILKGIEAPSPATIDAGTSSPIVLAFPEAGDAKLDGQITFDLKLGDETTESIGFGLADPAA
jgi:hypothetical protein